MGKVLKADCAVDLAYAQFDFGSAQDVVWITFDLAFDATALAYFVANQSNDFADILESPGGAVDVLIKLFEGNWQFFGPQSPTPAPESGAWHTFELGFDNSTGTSWLYIDAALVLTETNPFLVGIQMGGFTVGQNDGGEIDPAVVVYIDNVKAGTTQGASDLFADDFESGNLDAWTSTFGDVSVVNDPFAPTPPRGRFYYGYPWRTIITDLSSATVTCLDTLSASRTITYQLNRPATTSGRVPSDDPRVNAGVLIGTGPEFAPLLNFNDRLAYLLRREAQGTGTPWVCRWAGLVEQAEDAAQEDQPYSTFTGYDPWQYLFARPVMNGTALLGPDGLTFEATRGDIIAYELVAATIALHGPCYIDITSGVFGPTAVIDKINFQQGTSVGAALQQLCATGTMDIIMEPVYDPTGSPGICVVMNVYVQAGGARPEAVFSWDRGRQVAEISALYDGDKMANTVQFFNGQGGTPVAPAFDAESEARYGWWESQQFFPAQTEAVAVEAMAEFQLSLRKDGKRTVNLTPASLLAPVPLLDYGLGDRVPVWATSRLRQPVPVA